MKLLLCKYNNYYNRIVKRDYTYTFNEYKIIPNINFKYQNGIYAQQVINWDEDWNPDYLVVTKDSTSIPIAELIVPSVYDCEVEGIEVQDTSSYVTQTTDYYLFDIQKCINDHTTTYMGDFYVDFECEIPVNKLNVTFGKGDSRIDIVGDGPTIETVINEGFILDGDYLLQHGWTDTQNVTYIRVSGNTAYPITNIKVSKKEPEFEIDSRWFVINSDKNRKGQYVLNLKRDVIADNYNEVLTAPLYVEKAKLTTGDPLIYNTEDVVYNQIKQSQTRLNDKSGCPWIVGYVERQDDAEAQEIKLTINTPQPNYEYTDMADFMARFPYFNKLNQSDPLQVVDHLNVGVNYYDGRTDKSYTIFRQQALPGGSATDLEISKYNNPLGTTYVFGKESSDIYYNQNDIPSFFQMGVGTLGTVNYSSTQMLADFNTYGLSDVLNYLSTKNLIINNNEHNAMEIYVGKIFKIGSTFYEFKIKSTTGYGNPYVKNVNSSSDTTLFNYLDQYRKNTSSKANKALKNPTSAYVSSTNGYTILYEYYTVKYTLEELPENYQQTVKMTIPTVTNRLSLDDAPYDMFFMPYGSITTNDKISDKSFNFKLAMEISRTLGSKCFDVQILPYCPVQAWLTASGTISTSVTGSKTPYQTTNGVTLGYIYWAPTSSFTFQKEYYIARDTDPIELKVNNQCKFIRLMSPNSNSMYDFNPAKNNGVDAIKITCTYRPASPYIHLSPMFRGLYGYNFTDKRGLVCSGDYSLATVVDNWVEYQNQNKYYQTIFDRQIDHMEYENKWNTAGSIVGAITGTVQGTASGAMAGTMASPGIGTAVGAIVGGTTAAIGGVADIAQTVGMQKENIDYTKDLFDLNLRTIQAQPQSLSKISAFDLDNDFIPFVEVYDATDIEREQFRQKLKYNGMKVGRIGNIQEFIWDDEKTYIKGQLIRLENTNNDFHEVNEIASELMKGVFI